MRSFRRELNRVSPEEGTGRTWVFVPYDQLTARVGPLAEEDPDRLGIVLVENPWKASRRPYHRQKLALVLSNLRHFALEQAERGVAVRHVIAAGPYREALAPIVAELGPLTVMDPAERELREDLAPVVGDGGLRVVDHAGWLTTEDQFRRGAGAEAPWRMDAFYRLVRRESGVLMEGGKPAGGKFSFDAENRKAWPGDPPAPRGPWFEPDPVTEEVLALIETAFDRHPGVLVPEALPSTAADAGRFWDWARKECLPHFGPFEDAMARGSSTLFHTRISGLLNLHRLLPRDVVDDVVAMELPLASKEGFVRQVIGWREFVRHVHRATDGFRSLRGRSVPTADTPGDAGYAAWAGRRWKRGPDRGAPDGGARPGYLRSRTPVPAAFWGERSGLDCLDRVVADVWATGYGHHITRLMILSNLATLLDVEPRGLTDWFWTAYTDAYDWVVEPNVLGMGTYSAGDLMTTKPYISGAAYIDRMSDFCGACAFDPAKTCPVTRLYWAFLERKQGLLGENPRMRPIMASLGKRPPDRKAGDRRVYRLIRSRLEAGRPVTPDEVAAALDGA